MVRLWDRGVGEVKPFGSCRQHIFAAPNVRVLELLVFRGWHFDNAGEKVLYLSPDDDLVNARAATTVAPLPPPAPPRLRWVQYIYVDADGRRLPAYVVAVYKTGDGESIACSG